jgi:hypothetical protein
MKAARLKRTGRTMKRPTITATQRGVYHVLKHFGAMTDADLVRQYEILKDHTGRVHPSQSPSGLRTRRAELVAKGYVEATGDKLAGRRIWAAI